MTTLRTEEIKEKKNNKWKNKNTNITKNIIKVFGTITLFLLVSSLAIFCVSAATININTSNTNEEIKNFFLGTGTIEGLHIGNGDNIIFQNGIYNNLQITITKTINLMSSRTVIFNGNNTGTVITIKSTKTNISWLAINNYNTSIYGVNTKNIQIKNNKIENSTDGIKLLNSNNTTIGNNEISSSKKNTTGIYLLNSNSNNIIKNNVSGVEREIFVNKSSNKNQIKYNNLKNITCSIALGYS